MHDATHDYTARVIFCDDIRREDNGKLILIGVYSESLIPGRLPTSIPLAMWVEINGLPAGKHSFLMKAKYPAGKSFEIKGEIDVQVSNKSAHLYLLGTPVELVQPGQIEINCSINDSEPKIIARLGVVTPWESNPIPQGVE